MIAMASWAAVLLVQMLVAPSVAIPPPNRLRLLKAVCAHFNILAETPISNLNEIEHHNEYSKCYIYIYL